jgi:hypothetical protein
VHVRNSRRLRTELQRFNAHRLTEGLCGYVTAEFPRIVNGERATIQAAGQREAEKRGLLARLCAAWNAVPGRRQYRSDNSLSGIVPCRLISVIHRSYGAGPDTTKLVGAKLISTASI